MSYHPILGILIFLVAIILSFMLGKSAFRKYKIQVNTSQSESTSNKEKKSRPTEGEITSPDAPWLKE
tara:strand:+ start:656 stop:856 length:201 start_codon:yes stop_codon:yes gene_type:complete